VRTWFPAVRCGEKSNRSGYDAVFQREIQASFRNKGFLAFFNVIGKKKLLDQVSDVIRLKHYSIRTEETYLNWIRRFMLFHNKPSRGVKSLLLGFLIASSLHPL